MNVSHVFAMLLRVEGLPHIAWDRRSLGRLGTKVNLCAKNREALRERMDSIVRKNDAHTQEVASLVRELNSLASRLLPV
ncbi:MAG: hypothetical protein EBZ48_16470 [Proteobacteria bacterium]|nr:hypothetical protein [Pseudomonadota bacterium]